MTTDRRRAGCRFILLAIMLPFFILAWAIPLFMRDLKHVVLFWMGVW